MTSIFRSDHTPAPGVSVIELRDVHKHYGALHAVDGVTLTIPEGEIFGLIGHNGAGKSTLFKMMLGLISITRGEVFIAGARVNGRDFRAARRKIGYLPENVVLYDNLDGLETLNFFARLKGAPLTQCPALLERVGLAHADKRPVREYSKGMRQRLGFAQALLGSPRVLFLDEPTNGLDPHAIRDFYATLRELQQEGTTVVITSHILSELQERVDRLAILSAGQLRAAGSIQALRERTHIPLVFEVDLDAADLAAATELLIAATGAKPDVSANGLSLCCAREQKMKVLSALAPLGSRIRDLRMREPSLEDMFFGLAADAAATRPVSIPSCN